MRCHGPDGSGSSYAPNLTDSLKTMPYESFTEVVINGRQNVTGTQKNVMPALWQCPRTWRSISTTSTAT